MSRKRSHSTSSSDSDSSSSSSSSSSGSQKRHKKRGRSCSKQNKEEISAISKKCEAALPQETFKISNSRTKDCSSRKEHNKSRKRHDSSSSSSSSSSDSDDHQKRKKRERKKKKKEKKQLKKKMKKEKKRMKQAAKKAKKQAQKTETKPASTAEIEKTASTSISIPGPTPGPPIPELSDRAKAMKPMTKEEWDKRQQVIRKVYDEETGRHRLIKGDGEVLEEIVSKDRHREINRQATRGDGSFFQNQLAGKISR